MVGGEVVTHVPATIPGKSWLARGASMEKRPTVAHDFHQISFVTPVATGKDVPKVEVDGFAANDSLPAYLYQLRRSLRGP